MKRIKLVFAGVFGVLGSTALLSAHAETEVGKVVNVSGKVMARVESRSASRKAIPKVRQLKPSDPVFLEDVINTDSNGSVKILFGDQSIMDLGPSSLFKVEEFKNSGEPSDRRVEMSLSYGKIRAAINQKIGPAGKFKIKTRAATMGVRGTEFYVMSDIEESVDVGRESRSEGAQSQASGAPKTQVVVTEGKVEVAAAKTTPSGTSFQKPVEVLPGEKFTATLVEPNLLSGGDRVPASAEAPAPVVEKVAPEEMKAVVSEVKLVDTTFSKAIQIDVPKSENGAPLPALESLAGKETLAIIKDVVLSKPEIRNPAPQLTGLPIPGAPTVQSNFNGNFLPGFITGPLVRLRVNIR